MKRSQAQRILDVLADGREHSHHEFYGWCVLHSRIAELRRRGHEIEVRRDGDLYLYRLVSSAAATADAAPAPRIGAEDGRVPHNIGALLERHGFLEVIDGQLALEVA